MIVSFTSPKGGVGKSTACGTLAYAMAARGETVHILDLDPNGTLERLGRRAPRQGVTIEKSSEQSFAEDYNRAVAAGYDHIFIDLAGFMHVAILKAFTRSNLVIIPAGASEPDLLEAIKTTRHLAKIAEDIGRPIPYKLLLTRVATLRSRNGDFILDQIERMKLPMFRRGMTERQAYKSLFIEGTAPHETNEAAAAEIGEILGEILAVYVAELEQQARARA